MKRLELAAIVALSAVLTAACAPLVALEELEAEALRTGDWTRVEQRERLLEKRAARQPSRCPAGTVNYCERFAGQLDCQCVSRSAFGHMLAGR